MITLALALLLAVQDADPARIEDLVRRLGSEDFAAREEASKELRKIGPAAQDLLRKAAAEHADPEVRARAKALLEPERKPEPVPAPGAPRVQQRFQFGGGASVTVVNLNGDATYTITPPDGTPGIVFKKGKDGAVSLEHTDAEGKRRTDASDSIESFLKDHKALAERFGVTADGIEWAGNKVSFKGGAAGLQLQFGNGRIPKAFPFPPRALPGMAGVFLPVDEALRAHLDVPEGGAQVGPMLPGSTAEGLGLKRHDVLLEIDGQAVRSPEDAWARLKEGSRGSLLRKGKRENFGRRDF